LSTGHTVHCSTYYKLGLYLDPAAYQTAVYQAQTTPASRSLRRLHTYVSRHGVSAAVVHVAVGAPRRVRRRHIGRRLRAGPGHRLPGRQVAGVRQLAGKEGQAERGRRHRNDRQEEGGGPRRRQVQATAAQQQAARAKG